MRARLRKPGWMDLIESEFYLYSDAWNGMNICLFPNCCEKSSTCFCTNEYRSIFIIPESSPNPNPFQSNECRDNMKWTVCVVSIPAFPGTWCWAWWEGTSGIQSSRRWRCTRLDIGKGSWEYNTAVAGPWERTAHIGAGQFQEDERKCTLCTVHIHKFTRWRYVEALGEVNGAIQYCVSWCLNIFIMTCHWTEWLCSEMCKCWDQRSIWKYKLSFVTLKCAKRTVPGFCPARSLCTLALLVPGRWRWRSPQIYSSWKRRSGWGRW